MPRPTSSELQSESFPPFSTFMQLDINWEEFHGEAGKEHYKLLSWLASQVENSPIFDIGTHRGASALALSCGNPSNTIYSFDLEHKYRLPQVPSIQYSTDNLMTPEGRAKWGEKLLASPFIFLDIDPHEGSRELEFIGWLRENRYAGFVLCDDIWYFKEMRDNFWYRVPGAEKVDVTALGHWSGTGIIRFPEFASAKTLDIWPVESSAVPSNWTVVTAYFDLTKMPDASISIKARPAEHYLASARTTMAVEQNLVVFCEPESVELLKAMRPAWLLETHTKFMPMSFEEFPMTQYRGKIQTNRREKPYNFDDRNTASYYLLCMARYAMLKRVIAENPFGSTQFAWLNICIERMGWRNVAALDAVWAAQRERFSTCWIDYQPEPLVRNLPEYFKWGRCGMCSGFFTGSGRYMKEFCDEIEGKFLEALQAGYGHADEQLFSMVYFHGRGGTGAADLFDCYFGDYQEMVTNYVAPVDRPHNVVRLVIAHSLANKNYEVCEKACEAVWSAWKKGVAVLDDGQLRELVRAYRSCLAQQKKGVALP